jgi:hypothetical protein
MATEIPRTIQLISVALRIAALASTPGSDLAAAPKDISEKQGAGKSRNSTERPPTTQGYTGQSMTLVPKTSVGPILSTRCHRCRSGNGQSIIVTPASKRTREKGANVKPQNPIA